MNSVFYIQCKKIENDLTAPWKPGNIKSSSGSGFPVSFNNNNYVVTNAHVVKHASFIECKKFNSDKRYVLNVLNIAPEIDLALLQVKDKDFWKDVHIPDIALPPVKGSVVNVAGFPEGGLTASITSGVISRTNVSLYSKSVNNLVIQVDSAINPGNSGGPAFNDKDEIIGVAFSHNSNAQNVCFLIPSFILEYYINSCKKDINNFIGICDLDIHACSFDNITMHKFYMNEDRSGLFVDRVNPFGNCYLLKPGDIIHKIDDVIINNDMTVFFNPNKNDFVNSYKAGYEKVPYWQVVRNKYPDEKIILTITRNKKIKIIDIILKPMQKRLVPALYKEINTKYFIYGGLIFTTLNYWCLFGKQKGKEAPQIRLPNLYKYINEYQKTPDEEIVILYNILQTELTAGYKYDNIRLIKINNKEIENIDDVYKICNENTEEFMKFEFENNEIIIIEATNKETSQKISKQFLGVDYTNGFNL